MTQPLNFSIMKNIRHLFILITTFLMGQSAHANTPNILYIIADDMGLSDIGCYGGEIETPQLDALAKNGLRFTNYYVHNMCWPTRASLMTGLYPKTALPQKGSASGGLHPKATTLPTALRNAGYTTLMAGKWHLSDSRSRDDGNAPHDKGFDQFYGTIDGASDFFAPNDLQWNGKDMTHEWKDNPAFYYSDAIADYSIKFLKERPAEKPFYLYVSFTSAHWPLHAKPSDIAHYKGTYAMGWDALRKQRFERMKKMGVIGQNWTSSPRNKTVKPWEEVDDKAWQERRMEVYAAQVTNMDGNIGRILTHLKAEGALDNTLVVYQHDNGGCHVEYGTERTGSWTRKATTDGKQIPIRSGNISGLMPGPQSTFQSYGYGWANASNTPYREYKQFDHEGGTRSPLIISWKAGIPADAHNDVRRTVCHVIDIFPTLLEAANAAPITQTPMPFEGRSFYSSIISPIDPPPQSRTLFWQHGLGRAVRQGEWKAVSKKNKPWELYNLRKDPTELTNLANALPEKLAALTKLHEAWNKRTNLGQKKK